MVKRTNIEFEVDRGVIPSRLAVVPSGGTGSYPAVTMPHGYPGVKEP